MTNWTMKKSGSAHDETTSLILNHDESCYPKPPTPVISEDEEQHSPSRFFQIFSVVIMILITFLDYVLFAIIFPSLLYYIQSFGGNESFYSWTLFAYSLAQAISAPILGSWASQRTYREVMFFVLTLEVFASVLYAVAQNKWMIFITRVGLGIAAGSSAVTKAYFSATTTSENRTLVMTFATVAQALGFVAGPGIGGALAFINISVRESSPRIVFDKYTMAGWFSAALGLLCLALVLVCLREPTSSTRKRIISKREIDWETKRIEALIPRNALSKAEYNDLVTMNPTIIPYYDKIRVKKIKKSTPSSVSLFPVFVLLMCWFSSTTSFTIFETLAAAITKDQYEWDVLGNAVMWLSTAVGSIVVMSCFMAYTNVGHLILPRIFMWNDRILCILSFVVMIFGFAIMTDFGEHLHLARWIIGAFIISSGIAVNQTLINSLYSLVLDANNQGSWMGYQTTCGCIARIIAPLLAVYVYEKQGDAVIFMFSIALLGLSGVCCILCYIWMVPHPSHIVQNQEAVLNDEEQNSLLSKDYNLHYGSTVTEVN